MDAQAKKALFRAKLKESSQKRDKRIDSPLVRYNEHDQPVCRVCDVTLKSESLWPAHQASRKHHEAINNIKAAAAGRSQISDGKFQPHEESSKLKAESSMELHKPKSEPQKELHKPRSSSALPEGFFDNPEAKKPKTGSDIGSKVNSGAPQASVKLVGSGSLNEYGKPASSSLTHRVEPSDFKSKIDGLSNVHIVDAKGRSEIKSSSQLTYTSTNLGGTELKQAKGALPEGFFDNKDADLRARGIEPVKVDIKDEYKEFEKVIQGDLQEVDDRLEEEEFDAAEVIEGAESLEQKAYWERVEMLRKKQMELKAAMLARKEVPVTTNKEPINEESFSDEDDNDDDFAVDWRAKHI
ncbi:PREDICTED: zinc finger protein 830 [Nelumbo nucifera]|uniref:Zinc finger protein 830 n=2 Tax=Nelumbo nucifera TaxID=4432 RepID=A0A1U8Q3U5_NELNU|nr:PREDICTED: zinc finger protein 830 [Nelumbo nucifera]XP_010255244.1 PREDICTED: zinc finger protein 830 [Nelumbo nucifera]XP_019053269.1 PREDICTED: zinc finger protein 830 [Nelumbo nucifera]XP_019053270.1 PREDICTED: zinc finger protein 830 [Nelumbo nucifera]XP_019053271.1 PREDICTED: zinc finger protein 830 [Nelumbo nucifera]XP_019053272.1 PREDICTED: zinc finger protein 830 [Nelumbo nucifera]